MTSALITAAACSTIAVNTEHAAPRLGRYETFAIEPGPIVTEHALTAVPDQLVQDRIDAALHEELAERGLEPVQRKEAELIVTYAASTANQQEVVVLPTSSPGAGWFQVADVWVQDYRETNLTIDMIDRGTGQVVWRSTVRAMNHNLRSPKFIARAVSEAMEKFPPRSML